MYSKSLLKMTKLNFLCRRQKISTGLQSNVGKWSKKGSIGDFLSPPTRWHGLCRRVSHNTSLCGNPRFLAAAPTGRAVALRSRAVSEAESLPDCAVLSTCRLHVHVGVAPHSLILSCSPPRESLVSRLALRTSRLVFRSLHFTAATPR